MVDNVHVQTTQAREDAGKKIKHKKCLHWIDEKKTTKQNTSGVMALIETSPTLNAVDDTAAFSSNLTFIFNLQLKHWTL